MYYLCLRNYLVLIKYMFKYCLNHINVSVITKLKQKYTTQVSFEVTEMFRIEIARTHSFRDLDAYLAMVSIPTNYQNQSDKKKTDTLTRLKW